MATTRHKEVKLTHHEKDLFKTLLEASTSCEAAVTLRVAGGWVRDKLLGLESDDIDIALDTMLGKEFAEKACQCKSMVELMLNWHLRPLGSAWERGMKGVEIGFLSEKDIL